jgi:hypothetical protein
MSIDIFLSASLLSAIARGLGPEHGAIAAVGVETGGAGGGGGDPAHADAASRATAAMRAELIAIHLTGE